MSARLLLLLPPLAWALPAPAAGATLHVALCGGGNLDVPAGPAGPAHRDGACHATLCERARIAGKQPRLRN